MARDPKASKGEALPQEVAFDYIKNAHFRSLRADGAIGGVTPNGQIHVAFYSERPAIPRRLVYELDSDGRPGKEIGRESRNSIVREMDADLFLTLSVAKSIYNWLGQRIKELEGREDNRTKEGD